MFSSPPRPYGLIFAFPGALQVAAGPSPVLLTSPRRMSIHTSSLVPPARSSPQTWRALGDRRLTISLIS